MEDLCFDNKRMLLYRPTLDRIQVEHLKESIPESPWADEMDNAMRGYNPDSLSVINKVQTQAGICLSYRCQLNCRYCSYSSTTESNYSANPDDIMAFVGHICRNYQIKKLLTGLTGKLTFFFTGGGEPTFDWKLFCEVTEKIKDICHRNQIPVQLELTTNGMIDAWQTDYICKYFDAVMLSYDGLPDIQNRNRRTAGGKGSYEKVFETAQRFCRKNIPVTIRSTICQEDFPRMKEMVDAISSWEYPPSRWSILPVIAEGRALDNPEILGIQNGKEGNFTEYYLELLDYIRHKKLPFEVETSFFPTGIAVMFCGSIYAKCLWYLPDNSIVTCLEAKDNFAKVGHIKDGKVTLYPSYSDPLAKMAFSNLEACRDCIAFPFCKGGCPLKSLRHDSAAIAERDWECRMIRSFWKHIFSEVMSGRSCFGWTGRPIIMDGIKIGDAYLILKEEELSKNKKNDMKELDPQMQERKRTVHISIGDFPTEKNVLTPNPASFPQIRYENQLLVLQTNERKIVELNSSAEAVWNMALSGITDINEMVNCLIERYALPEEKRSHLLDQVEKSVESLHTHKLL